MSRPIPSVSAEVSNARLKARLDEESRLDQAISDEVKKASLFGRFRAMNRWSQVAMVVMLLSVAGGAYAWLSAPPYRHELPPDSVHLVGMQALAPGSVGKSGVQVPVGTSVIEATLQNGSHRSIASAAYEISLRNADGSKALVYVEADQVKSGASAVVDSEPVAVGAKVVRVRPFSVKWEKSGGAS